MPKTQNHELWMCGPWQQLITVEQHCSCWSEVKQVQGKNISLCLFDTCHSLLVLIKTEKHTENAWGLLKTSLFIRDETGPVEVRNIHLSRFHLCFLFVLVHVYLSACLCLLPRALFIKLIISSLFPVSGKLF